MRKLKTSLIHTHETLYHISLQFKLYQKRRKICLALYYAFQIISYNKLWYIKWPKSTSTGWPCNHLKKLTYRSLLETSHICIYVGRRRGASLGTYPRYHKDAASNRFILLCSISVNRNILVQSISHLYQQLWYYTSLLSDFGKDSTDALLREVLITSIWEEI